MQVLFKALWVTTFTHVVEHLQGQGSLKEHLQGQGCAFSVP